MPGGNIMSNIMTDIIKKKVSKSKKRFTKDGFNLDLTYILPNLIAMGFPAEKIETVYRNNMSDVLRFFESKHEGSYKIYNLCSEREYDIKKFHSRVAIYPFQDHNPPNFEQINVFCKDVHKWLNSNPKNIAAVHCKAGKGRTGTMICCYLLYSKICTTAEDSLRFFGEKRTHDHKGVTIPSQRRYVEYYASYLCTQKLYTQIPIQITRLQLSAASVLNGHTGMVYYSLSYLNDTKEEIVYTEKVSDIKKSCPTDGLFVIDLDQCVPIAGDIKIEFFVKSVIRSQKLLFRFWFNSFFVTNGKDVNDGHTNVDFELTKCELDYACKDEKNKICPPDFKVTVSLQTIPSDSYVQNCNQNVNYNNHQHHNHHNNTSMNSLPDAQTPSESPEASSSDSSAGAYWEPRNCIDTNSDLDHHNHQHQFHLQNNKLFKKPK